jgi:Tfp pilus assembly protein PilO
MIKNLIQKWKNDKRKYTFMIVPHGGDSINSIKFSSKFVKTFLICLLVVLISSFGAFAHYRYVVNKAQAEHTELETLRVVHQGDIQEIQKLQKLTTDLQSKIDQLNKTDKEIRNIIGN